MPAAVRLLLDSSFGMIIDERCKTAWAKRPRISRGSRAGF